MPPELRPRKETPTPSKPAPVRRSRKTPLKLADYLTTIPAGSGVENNDSSRVEKKRVRSRGKKETDEVRQHDVIQVDYPETPNISLELTGSHGNDKDKMEPIFETPSTTRIDKNLDEYYGVQDKGEVAVLVQKDNDSTPISTRRRELDLNKSLGSWQLEEDGKTPSEKQMVSNEVEVICLDDDDDGNCDNEFVGKLHGKTKLQSCSDKPNEVLKPSLSTVGESVDPGLDAVGMTVEQAVEEAVGITVKQSKEMEVVEMPLEHGNGGPEEAVGHTKVVEVVEIPVTNSNASPGASVEHQMEVERSVEHTCAVEVVEMPVEHASVVEKNSGKKQIERGTERALVGDGEGTETKVAKKQKEGVQESEMIEEEKLEVEESQSNRPETAHMRVVEQRWSEPEHGNKDGIERNSAGEHLTWLDGVEQVQAADSMPGNENRGDQAVVDGRGEDHLKENAIKEFVIAQDVQVSRHMVVGDREHDLQENVKEDPIMAQQHVQVDMDRVDGEGKDHHLKENPKEDSHMLQNLQAGEVCEKNLPSEGPGTGKLHDCAVSELTQEVKGHRVLEERETLTDNDAGDSHDSSSAESEPKDEEAQVLKGICNEDEAKESEDNAECFDSRNASEIKDETDSNDEDSDEEEDDTELIKMVAKSLNTHLKQENMRVGSKDRADPSNSTSRTDGIDEVMYIDDSGDRDEAEAAADAMHIRWAPKTGLPMIDGNRAADSSGWRTGKGISEKSLERSIWRGEKNLEDGLLVPSLDPRKLRKLAKKAAKDTAGSKWFDMPAPTVTPEIKKELQLLQLRGVMDPKRHYKASDMKGIPKYFQIGTVVEGGADFYSGRLTKKERKGTFADELLADTSLKAYRKRKYTEIQEEKQAGGKNFWKQKKNRQKPSWAKT